MLQAKCLSELLGRTLRGDNQLRFFFTWAVLILWLVLTVFWLHRMNTGTCVRMYVIYVFTYQSLHACMGAFVYV